MQTRNVNLPITVTGRHMELTDAIKEYARKKIEGLHLDHPKIIEAKVILDVREFRHYTEIILFCSNHLTLEATAETNDWYASMDEAIDKIARQMRKAKTRILKNQQESGKKKGNGGAPRLREAVEQLEEFELDESPAERLVEPVKASLQTLSVDDAVLQLQVSGQPFLVFINEESQKPNVLYRSGSESAVAAA